MAGWFEGMEERLKWADRMPEVIAMRRIEAATTHNADGTDTIDLSKICGPRFVLKEPESR